MNQRTRVCVEQLEERATPATITVTSPGDDVADGDGVTLREAITAANTDTTNSGHAGRTKATRSPAPTPRLTSEAASASA